VTVNFTQSLIITDALLREIQNTKNTVLHDIS